MSQYQAEYGNINDFVNKRKNPDYVPVDKRSIHPVDKVLKLLSVMTGDNRYEDILKDERKEGIRTRLHRT